MPSFPDLLKQKIRECDCKCKQFAALCAFNLAFVKIQLSSTVGYSRRPQIGGEWMRMLSIIARLDQSSTHRIAGLRNTLDSIEIMQQLLKNPDTEETPEMILVKGAKVLLEALEADPSFNKEDPKWG